MEQRNAAEKNAAKSNAATSNTNAIPGSSGRKRKLSFKEQQELEGIEGRIHEMEAEIKRIEALFATPNFHRDHGPKTQELTDELNGLKAKIPTLFTRWEELDAIKSQAG